MVTPASGLELFSLNPCDYRESGYLSGCVHLLKLVACSQWLPELLFILFPQVTSLEPGISWGLKNEGK